MLPWKDQTERKHKGSSPSRMHFTQPTLLTKREKDFFFELCCARHYNCGSHWAVLVLSLLDNEIRRKGQGPRKSRQTKTQNNTKREKDKVTQTFSGPVKVRQPEKTSMYTPLQAQDKQVGESERPR